MDIVQSNRARSYTSWVGGCDVFHIIAVGNWLAWGKQMLHTRLGMQFSSHGELDGGSSHFRCANLFETMCIVQMQRCFGMSLMLHGMAEMLHIMLV